MPTLTDPASEIVDICVRLREHSSDTGANFLAARFKVDVQSAKFYEIIFVIISQMDKLFEILSSMDIDEKHLVEINGHLNALKAAFSPAGLQQHWVHASQNYLTDANLNSIKGLSVAVRQKHSYPSLSEEEKVEVLSEVKTLLNWLSEHQLVEQDFIRQAIISGLQQFQFRLERVGWLGWGYTLDSLREVISAYLILERGETDIAGSPDSAALLKKLSSFVKGLFSKVGTVRQVAGDVSFMVLAYEKTVQLSQGTTNILGLLTFTGP
jgi:hypothetical protein